MFGWTGNQKIRRNQVRQRREQTLPTLRRRVAAGVGSWPLLSGVLFVATASAAALLGGGTIGYSIGQRISQPIPAEVAFQVRDPQRTAGDREAARAATPSYYTLNLAALTFDRVRADLMRLYEAAANAKSFEEYEQALNGVGWPADRSAYTRLRTLVDQPNDEGRRQFQEWTDKLPLESEYVVRDLLREPRNPHSATDYLMLERTGDDGQIVATPIPHAHLVPQGHEKALRGSAADVARRFPPYDIRSTVEAIVFSVLGEQPTIVYNQERTTAKMKQAESATPEALTTYEKDKAFISQGVLSAADYDLLKAHRLAYEQFLEQDNPEAAGLRRERLFQRAGMVALVALLSFGFVVYTYRHQPAVFEARSRTVALWAVILATLSAARLLQMNWSHLPELVYAPCLLAGSALAIVYPQRFALGAIAVTCLTVTTMIGADLTFLLPLLIGAAVAVYQLKEIRSRTKVITSGLVTAVAMMAASAAGGLVGRHAQGFILERALWSGGAALLAAFVLSGILPFIERLFRIATSLTLLEWRDPTRPLLQLLAREASGTYNHSLVVGTLAEAACEAIGANGLLAQVGALYHDIGKIHKAEYFTENQEGRINRHENLAPTMSLLIILGHVKDGIEMAKEYKLPRVLRQFIEEHHGTTVVRYFHHMASEKQPRIASGKHDREVSEAEFRYSGPKPGTPESAVVMLCDSVEGAVRSVPEPTVGRIESVVHQVVTDRLDDGQFDDCDITLKEIRKVEECLVKSLCGIYHGRLAYPKALKPEDEPMQRERALV